MADGTFHPPALDFVRPQSLRQLRRLQPVWHGHYADLSYIYACINALRLLLEPSRPLPPRDCEQLFRFAVRFLDRAGLLAATVERGLAPAGWTSLVRGVADRAEDLACMRLAMAQPYPDGAVTFDQVNDAVRSAIDAREVVLIALAGHYEHYTVIAGYSRTRFRLFDGYGCSWLNLEACDVASDIAIARHQIDPRSMVTLGLAPTQHVDLLKDSS
ncbi:hypothetical protein [Sphingomonas sp. PB4P5]|uniref:hypothetical protein n=1 Tax=Parasphingomonas puruogangriensis TaxID=3096155 RepID=UPI002FC87022